MECCFCKSANTATKAIHLDPSFPLCETCLELRDFMQEWAATKEQHGLDPAEYGLRIWQAAQESTTAAVH